MVTDLGVYDFDNQGELRVVSLHPDVTPEEVRSNTGWDIEIPARVKTILPPVTEELRILRERLDPNCYYLQRASAS